MTVEAVVLSLLLGWLLCGMVAAVLSLRQADPDVEWWALAAWLAIEVGLGPFGLLIELRFSGRPDVWVERPRGFWFRVAIDGEVRLVSDTPEGNALVDRVLALRAGTVPAGDVLPAFRAWPLVMGAREVDDVV